MDVGELFMELIAQKTKYSVAEANPFPQKHGYIG